MNSSSTSSSDLPSTGTIRPIRALAFLCAALGLLLGLNALGGIQRNTSDAWMGPLLAPEQSHPFSVYIFGSSRVAAAVDVAVFDKILSENGIQGKSINLGMGYSRTSEYYFAARQVLSKKPDLFRGSTVLLEAPLGLPEYSTWDENWMVEDAVDNLAAYLRPSDLPRFILHSRSSPLSKALVVGRVLFGFHENYSRLRFHANNAVTWIVSRSEPAKKGADADLTSAGGIRVDSAGVAAVRHIALDHERQEIQSQVPQREWEETTLKDFLSLLEGAGAKVVLFTIPLSPIQSIPLLTPVRQVDRKYLEGTLQRWKVPMIHPSIQTGEADFPDFWHLRRSRAPEFSTSLARSYLELVGSPPAPSP